MNGSTGHDLLAGPAGVAIIGGTGALGRGLAVRWAAAGVDVRIGSRDEQRARDAAATVRERLRDCPSAGSVTGGHNRLVAAEGRTVVLAVPLAGLEDGLSDLDGVLEGRLVICAVNPLGFDDAGPHLAAAPGHSVATWVAGALPGAEVVAAFHTLSSRELAAWPRPMEDDVLIVGDDEAACAAVAALADLIEGCRGIVAGPLRLAVCLEALTPVLIGVNRRSSAHVGVRLSRFSPRTV